MDLLNFGSAVAYMMDEGRRERTKKAGIEERWGEGGVGGSAIQWRNDERREIPAFQTDVIA